MKSKQNRHCFKYLPQPLPSFLFIIPSIKIKQMPAKRPTKSNCLPIFLQIEEQGRPDTKIRLKFKFTFKIIAVQIFDRKFRFQSHQRTKRYLQRKVLVCLIYEQISLINCGLIFQLAVATNSFCSVALCAVRMVFCVIIIRFVIDVNYLGSYSNYLYVLRKIESCSLQRSL